MRHTVLVQDDAVPRIGLGTRTLPGTTGTIGRAAIREALGLGYRLLDTVHAEEGEREIAAAVAESGVPRDELFLSVRLWPGHAAPVCVRPAVEAALRTLRTDRLDLLLLAWPPPARLELSAVLDAMAAVREAGLARHVGVSNFTPALLARAVALAPIACHQVEHHPYLVQPELLRLAEQHGLLHVAYSPLARGFALRDRALGEIARARGASPAQVALRWLLEHPRVAAIPRSRSAEHLAANLRAPDVALSEAELRCIDGLERGMRLNDPPHAPIWHVA